MNKYLFLFELRKELSYMTPDDKESAARYYEEYFAEAGPENEQKIIEELGPPARLAAEIKREYEEGRPEPTGRDLAVPNSKNSGRDYSEPAKENSYKPFEWDGKTRSPLGNDPFAKEEENEADDANSDKGNCYDSGRPYGSRPSNRPPFGSYKYGSYRYGSPAYGSREYAADGGNKAYEKDASAEGADARETVEKKRMSVWLIVVLAVFALPIGVPIAITIVSLAAAFIAVFFSVFISFIICGAAIVAMGIAIIIAGFWALAFLPDALMMFGAGLILIALGLPLLWLSIWSCAKASKGAAKGIGAVVGLIRRKGGKKGE